MKTIMKKVLSVLMVLAMLLVPMTVMAEDAPLGDYYNPYQLSTTSVRFYVTVEPGVDVYIQVDDCDNSTVNVGYATGDYMLMYGRQAVNNNDDDEKTATLTLQTYSDIFGVSNLTEETIYVYMSLTAGSPAEVESGTMDNPEVVTIAQNMFGGYGANVETQLDAGNQGYYYSVKAPSDGIITVSVNAMDDEYNYIGWFYYVNNMTAYKYGDSHWSDDEEPVYYEHWTVSEGDELVVFAATYDPDNMWSNPAGTVIVDFSFAPKGSSSYPFVLTETGDYATTVAQGSNGSYYEWVATADGTVTVAMDDESGWQYSISKVPVDEDDYSNYYNSETHWYDDDPVVTTETVDVEPGETVKVWVNTYDSANMWPAPAGTVNWSIDFAEKKALTFSIDDTDAFIGKEFDVVVNVSNNTGIISAVLEIGYDADILELVAVNGGDFAATDATVTDEGDNVVVDENGYSYGPLEGNTIMINWVDALAKENVTTNGTFAVLTFKVKDEVAVGDTQITISCDPENVFDKDFNNVKYAIVDATITVKSHTPGDVNNDGKVNNRDYALVMQHINKWDVEIVEAAADVNADGKINNRDYALIMQHINKWDVELK